MIRDAVVNMIFKILLQNWRPFNIQTKCRFWMLGGLWSSLLDKMSIFCKNEAFWDSYILDTYPRYKLKSTTEDIQTVQSFNLFPGGLEYYFMLSHFSFRYRFTIQFKFYGATSYRHHLLKIFYIIMLNIGIGIRNTSFAPIEFI